VINKSEIIGVLKYSLAFLGWMLFITYIFTAVGCSNSSEAITNIRDSDFDQGCYIDELNLNFDSYFNTTKGSGKICKVKCSDKLPKHFYYKYDDNRTGCHIQIGVMNNAN